MSEALEIEISATTNTPHDRLGPKTTDIWLTPPHIFMALGAFDLDPCAAPFPRPWPTAANHYDITQGEDGLLLPWFGRIWLNPPFSTADEWIEKMSRHRRGILLMAASLETERWMERIWPKASAVLLVSPRVSFLLPSGSRPKSGPTKQTALIAFSEEDAAILETCPITGSFLRNWITKSTAQ